MKKIIFWVMLLVLGVVLSGCDVTYDIQKDDSVIITIECDEDDVDEFGEDFDFDEGDLDNKEDLEDILDDIVDEYDDLEGEISVKSFKRDKNDDFTLVFEFLPNSDIYDDEFSDDVDDEKFYAYDKYGDEMTDKEMEEYFDNAKLSKLKAAFILAEDVDVYVPGKIEMIISPDDSVDVDDGAISFENYAYIIYKTSSNALLIILLIVFVNFLWLFLIRIFSYDHIRGLY